MLLLQIERVTQSANGVTYTLGKFSELGRNELIFFSKVDAIIVVAIPLYS